MSERREDGGSFHDQPKGGWPKRRVIWSCTASRGPLLTRYYLIETAMFAVYLHHLHVSDEDRALHDHPWAFISVLLSSGYFEWVQVTGGYRKLWRRRFSVLCRPAVWRHRLELVQPTWTLIVRSRRLREWGFMTEDKGWMHWKAYGREFCD